MPIRAEVYGDYVYTMPKSTFIERQVEVIKPSTKPIDNKNENKISDQRLRELINEDKQSSSQKVHSYFHKKTLSYFQNCCSFLKNMEPVLNASQADFTKKGKQLLLLNFPLETINSWEYYDQKNSTLCLEIKSK
jgi:hypothetical protein